MALMPTYPNGRVPADKLVVFNTGTDRYGRYFEWRLPPSTYRKHLALVARALKRTGRTLSPSEGWSCYRPYAEQVFARSIHGNYAAKPGTSSHGGSWAGPPTGWRLVDTAAIDYHNWAWVYENHGGRTAWFADIRAVGLIAGGISAPAFPDEPWHVIDIEQPYAEAAPADSGSEPFPATKETKVDIYNRKDATARDGGRTVKPNGSFWLNETKGAATTAASNLVGKVGNYSSTVLVQATGAPGDVLVVQLFLNLPDRATHSGLHEERLTFDRGGRIRASFERKPHVTDGVAVLGLLTALETNTKPVTVTIFDVDSYRFVTA